MAPLLVANDGAVTSTPRYRDIALYFVIVVVVVVAIVVVVVAIIVVVVAIVVIVVIWCCLGLHPAAAVVKLEMLDGLRAEIDAVVGAVNDWHLAITVKSQFPKVYCRFDHCTCTINNYNNLLSTTTTNHDHDSTLALRISPMQPQAAHATDCHQGPANAVAPTTTMVATAATTTRRCRQPQCPGDSSVNSNGNSKKTDDNYDSDGDDCDCNGDDCNSDGDSNNYDGDDYNHDCMTRQRQQHFHVGLQLVTVGRNWSEKATQLQRLQLHLSVLGPNRNWKSEKEIESSGHRGHATWLSSGLKIQEMQLSLQALVRKIGSHPMPDQQRDIALKCAWLQERVDTFQKQAANILQASHDSGDDSWDNTPLREAYIGIKFDGIGEGEDNDERTSSAKEHVSGNHSTDSSIDVEYISLHLPSHLGHDWCNKNGAEDLAKAELHLREGQLNDSLHHLHISLGHKSYLFRHDVHPACTQRLKMRAWAEVHAAESTVQHHAQVDTRAWQAMVDLGASSSLLDRYKVLRRQDLSVKTSVIAPHVHGQRNKLLPSFWTMDVWRDANIGEWMEDLHWLQAKAQKMRWIEELQCLQVEMESAIRFFKHQEQSWQAKQELIEPQLQGMLCGQPDKAGSKFTTLLKSDPPPEFAKYHQLAISGQQGLKTKILQNHTCIIAMFTIQA
ncbi:hypothetical protein EDB89DRAFT_1909473 [Lactarius sanguifluus]|nr:hypothetical protein EDB89DRAFT_1909473 [Lactarius sanguifluus]